MVDRLRIEAAGMHAVTKISMLNNQPKTFIRYSYPSQTPEGNSKFPHLKIEDTLVVNNHKIPDLLLAAERDLWN